MSPRVTVAVRTKNRPLLLRRALASVRAQTMRELELVIVNDAGELAPVEAAIQEVLGDPGFPVRVIDNPVSQGREAAMNLGFAESRADYLVLHDDDDSWAPEFLARTVAHLDAHPEEGAVATRTSVIFEHIAGDTIVEQSREVLAADAHRVTLAEILRANFVPPISLLFRRAAYERLGGFDGTLPVLADWDFTLRLLREAPIGFVDGEPLAFWHQRRGAAGDEGNSVFVAADDHASYDERIRDRELRETLDSGDRLGELLYLARAFESLERRVAGMSAGTSDTQSQVRGGVDALHQAVTQLELAIGRIEGRLIETQLGLARVEQLARAGGPLRRAIADRVRRRRGDVGSPPPGADASARDAALSGALSSTSPATGETVPGRGVAPASASSGAEGPSRRIRGALGRTASSIAGRRRTGRGRRSESEILARRVGPRAWREASVRAPAPAAPVELPARTPRGDARFPAGGRRGIIYLFFDPLGQVDDYVTLKLAALREHAEEIFVVSNGPLGPEGRAKLEDVADTVWERENVGFDVWGYKEAQEQIGWDRLAELDELILMNYTFFGPVYPFSETFDRVDGIDVDFWGLTEHGEVTEEEAGVGNRIAPHIQSHWIAVRGPMLRSPDYRAYWDEMPAIESYNASIQLHEARFTEHFGLLGFSHLVAWPASDYPSRHPIFDDIVRMLDDRLPIVKRRLFFHDPLYLERNVIIGRDVRDRLERAGYPMDVVWSNIVRSSKPRALATNMGLLEILPDAELAPETGRALDRAALPSIAVVMHLYYDEMLDEMLDYVERLPGAPRLIITTTSEDRVARIEAGLVRRGFSGPAEVRLIASNRGRDISAFYVGCADVLRDESIDLVVKIHGKRSVQDGANAGAWFKRHLLDNLLPTPGYAANLVAMFQRDPTLGLVFPPVVNLGYPTLGHAWFTNRGPAERLAKQLGIHVPFDDATPLAPLGSMFVARREALALLVEAGLDWDDFPAETGYKDGTLAHVLERLVTYAAAERGYRVETVMSSELAAISHGFLEYRLQATQHVLPGATTEESIRLAQYPGVGMIGLMGMRWFQSRAPHAAEVLWPVYRAAVRTAKLGRRIVRRG